VIGSLRGEVLERGTDGTVLVDVAGVGYIVTVSAKTLGELEPTTTTFLYIHHHIREDDQTLYGFLTRDERTTFKVLIATHGVGPAMAMAILATYPPPALIDVVANRDKAALTMVPGVGPKTAERLLVELKNRLSVPVLEGDSVAGMGTNGASAAGTVREALAGLGYAPEEIRDVVREIANDTEASTMLRDALKLLGAKRG
jgi:holliday junction DNA helicase RuvA